MKGRSLFAFEALSFKLARRDALFVHAWSDDLMAQGSIRASCLDTYLISYHVPRLRMHPVLQIPELLDLILQNFCVFPPIPGRRMTLSPEDLLSDKDKRRALYYATLTSRGIAKCALPILWSTIDGVAPLLRLIPSLQLDITLKKWVSRSVLMRIAKSKTVRLNDCS
jgi:hypothetical protein